MTIQLSFSKDENELLPDYRNKIARAESTEDVKKIFTKTVGHLLERVFGDSLKIEYGDVSLKPGELDGHAFTLNDRIKTNPAFTEIWEKSDLRHVLGRLAQTAHNRHKHLEKHPEKTNAKIRM